MAISEDAIAVETRYDLTVLTELQYPYPEEVEPVQEEAIDDQRRNHFNDAIEAYRHDVEHSWAEYADEYEEAEFEPPNPVLDELRSTAARIAGLQNYLNQLIIYARLFAAEPATARTVAQVTGLSHSTIVRMATPELIAQVAAQVQPIARAQMEAFQPASDPLFYRRLAAIAASTTPTSGDSAAAT